MSVKAFRKIKSRNDWYSVQGLVRRGISTAHDGFLPYVRVEVSPPNGIRQHLKVSKKC